MKPRPRPKPKAHYQEGDWFAVPLCGGRYAVGVVARATGEGPALGYFFGPVRAGLPHVDELTGLSASQATLIRVFGDLALLEGRWPVIGSADGWNRAAWPVPTFGRYSELERLWRRVEYADGDPVEALRETVVSEDEGASLPGDGLLGAGAVEKLLVHLLVPVDT